MAIFLATDQKGQFGITSSVKQTEDLQKYSDNETTIDKSSSNKLRYETLTEPELTIALLLLIQTNWNIESLTSEKKLLTMVRSVSEDKLYDTIEFNEFLQVRQLTTIATNSHQKFNSHRKSNSHQKSNSPIATNGPIVTKSPIITNREKRAEAAETSVFCYFSLILC